MTLAEQTEQAWAAHYEIRNALLPSFENAIHASATGAGLSNSAVAAIADVIADVLSTSDPNIVAQLASTWHDAKTAEEARNAETAAAAEVAPTAPFLETADTDTIREELKTASADTVDEWLNALTSSEERRVWAETLHGFAVADGNRADVIDVLNRHNPPPAEVPAPPDPVTDVDTTGTGQTEPVGSGDSGTGTDVGSVEDAQVADALDPAAVEPPAEPAG